MSITTSEMTPADIAAVTNNNNDGFFGGNGAWWIIILLLFGWGRGGYGFGGNGEQGAANNYVLTSDFSQLSRQISDSTAMTERKLDGVNNGLCSGFYQEAQLINGVNMQAANNTASIQNTLTQGFAGINTGMVQQGYDTRNAITQAQINQMQNTNAIQSQIAQCCCDTRATIADVNYNMATQAAATQRQVSDTGYGITTAVDKGFCQTNFNNSNNTRDIIYSAHGDADRIIARLDAMENARQQERIQELTAENNRLALAASQSRQNEYLIDKLGPKCPSAAYVVQPPQQVTFPTNCCGGVNFANSGCGCG